MFVLSTNEITVFKSYVIVLDNHPWGQEMANDAISSGNDFGWHLEKFSAVDGRTVNAETCLSEYGLRLYTGAKKHLAAMQRPGVFGNLLSHFKLWQLCLQLNEPIGCFEHDIIFHGSYDKIDMGFDNLLKLDRSKLMKKYGTGNCYQGVYAYIIKPAGAKKLIDWSYKNGVTSADVMVGDDVLDIAFDDNKLISFNPKQQSDKNGYTPFSTSKTMTF